MARRLHCHVAHRVFAVHDIARAGWRCIFSGRRDLGAGDPRRRGRHRTRRSDAGKGSRLSRRACLPPLDAGSKVLRSGGSSLDAVEAAIRVLEDDPLFNAGRGAVFTADGRNELDASIMDGATRKAGAVAGVTRTRNPISLARAVMEKSRHVMLAREGADQFSVEQGLATGGSRLLPHRAALAAVARLAARQRDSSSIRRIRAAPWVRSRSMCMATSPRVPRRAA